jgi:hypothetical protein
MDIKIDVLRINMADAAGYEHRIRPIAARATTILLEGLSDKLEEWDDSQFAGNNKSVSAEPVNVELRGMTDEQAAHSIAGAWLSALALKLR